MFSNLRKYIKKIIISRTNMIFPQTNKKNVLI